PPRADAPHDLTLGILPVVHARVRPGIVEQALHSPRVEHLAAARPTQVRHGAFAHEAQAHLAHGLGREGTVLELALPLADPHRALQPRRPDRADAVRLATDRRDLAVEVPRA